MLVIAGDCSQIPRPAFSRSGTAALICVCSLLSMYTLAHRGSLYIECSHGQTVVMMVCTLASKPGEVMGCKGNAVTHLGSR